MRSRQNPRGCGNNTLIGGNNSGGGTVTNFLIGAALSMKDSAHAGDNTLIAGTAAAGSTVSNDMWGNAQIIDGIFINGSNDIPSSSKVTLGQDTFIFKDTGTQTVGTQNFIHDFSQSQHDVIEFAGVFDGANTHHLIQPARYQPRRR